MKFRNLYSDGLRLFVLPPRSWCCACSPCCSMSVQTHHRRLEQIQRLRGRVYVEDGALHPSLLDTDGKHLTAFDHDHWHILVTDEQDEVCACFLLIRYPEDARFEDLKLYELIDRMSPALRPIYEASVRAFMSEASGQNLGFGEVAAWAVRGDVRNRPSSLMFSFAAWALYQLLGESLVVGAPTTRHNAATILRRIGGFPLRFSGFPLQRFYDDRYGCDMEIIGFNSCEPLLKYSPIILEIRDHMETLIKCSPRFAKVSLHLKMLGDG